MKDAHRQHGTIEAVRCGDEDGRFITAWIFVKFEGSVQGFGGFVLNDVLLENWKAELCALFQVRTFEDLVGKHCWALRCFSGWNEPIQGLEAPDGLRFTATDFFRRNLKKTFPSVLDEKRESLRATIASATRRINDATAELTRLESDYVDWDRPAKATNHERVAVQPPKTCTCGPNEGCSAPGCGTLYAAKATNTKP